jgi:hypothetical protein
MDQRTLIGDRRIAAARQKDAKKQITPFGTFRSYTQALVS